MAVAEDVQVAVLSEVEVHTEFQQPRTEHAQRLAPHGEVAILRQNRVGVEHVIEIDAHDRSGVTEPQYLARPEIGLIETIADTSCPLERR